MNIFVTLGAFIFSSEFWTQDLARMSVLSSQWGVLVLWSSCFPWWNAGVFLHTPPRFGMERLPSCLSLTPPQQRGVWDAAVLLSPGETNWPEASAAVPSLERHRLQVEGRCLIGNRCLGCASWVLPLKAPNNKTKQMPSVGDFRFHFVWFLSLPILTLL